MEKGSLMFEILDNEKGLYDGDLWYYFKLVFSSHNVDNPYHNFRHLMHAMCMVYTGAIFMNYPQLFGKRMFRALLISPILHDYKHSGVMGNDQLEVDRSISEMKKHLLPEDRDLVDEIENFMRATQYPYVACRQNMGTDLIRDADMSSLFSEAWIQQVIFGIAKEKGITPLEMLKLQLKFIPRIVFHTQWAKETFAPYAAVRLEQVKKMISKLESENN